MGKALINNDNLRTIISLLSLLLSIINFYYIIISNKCKINISCKEYMFANFNKKMMFLQMSIENMSRTTISISRMFIVIEGKEYEFSWIPEIVYNARITVGNEEREKISLKSITLPQNISAYGVVGGYFKVVLENDNMPELHKFKKIDFILYTNKGIKRITSNLSKFSFRGRQL